MRRRIKSHLLTSYLATVALALAVPAAHADRPGWLALHTPWRDSLASRLFAGAPRFSPAAASLPSAPVGSLPQFAAENYSTHTLYVVNSQDNTVSVVNLATCNSGNLSGCARPSPTIGVGLFPLGVAVDEATDTVYVANAVDGTVSVVDGSTCNASDSSGCDQTPTTVAVGAFDNALIVDPVTNTVFVTNSGESNPGTVSVIDGHSCNGTDHSGCAAQPEAAVSVGDGPSGIGVNPATDTIYVTNTGFGNPVPNGHTVSVIDGATCRAGDLSGCAAIGTVPVGLGPINLTIDPTTNTIYLGDTYADTAGHGFITVLTGATCDAVNQSGCASDAHPIVTVGADPIGYAVDPNNHSVYITNANDDTISVIDDTKCDAKRSAGCKNPPPTIKAPGAPSWPVVDPATHTIYVVDQADNDVAVLNDRSCDAETTAGCRHPAPTAPAGSFPNAATTDTRFGTVYIGDSHAFQPPYTITMIDAARCKATPSDCNRPPRTLAAVGSPLSMAADQRTNTIYVATDGPLQVIDAATCNAMTTASCNHTSTVPAGGRSVAVDPSTDTIYALNNQPDGSGYVNVIDGRHCNGADTSGCAAQTSTTVPTVRVGNQIAFGITAPTVDRTPDRLAIDDLTHTVYVTNAGDDTVSVIDITHCHAGDTSQCASLQPPTVPLPGAIAPIGIAVDPATNTAYVTDNPFPAFPDAVSLIDTAHCRAGDTSQCVSQTPPSIPMPSGGAFKIQVDPTTNNVYVANVNDSSVSVIDGNRCNASDTVGCSRIPTIQVSSNPSDLTLDLVNRTAYVPNFYDDDASVFGMLGPS